MCKTPYVWLFQMSLALCKKFICMQRSIVVGLSTCKGKKLEFNEVVHFAFLTTPTMKIVRFSTKRWGEIGRLPLEWTKCTIPLIKSGKVKLRGRCVAAPNELSLMQEIHLYASFYIHKSVFTEGDRSSWKLTESSHLDTTIHPLLTLLKLLKVSPFEKAQFTPEELDSRKRSLNLRGDSEADLLMPSLAKRIKGSHHPEQSDSEQIVSESTLNKLVASADVYNLKEMNPPSTLTCVLYPYQKQALYWMSEAEKEIDVQQAAKTLHPCWAAYRLNDKRASAVYVNIFSGEATTQFPSATQMARGGILADAMGLGKTVMTIALILAKPGRGVPDDVGSKEHYPERGRQNKKDSEKYIGKVKGGTLIVCPTALLGQWKRVDHSAGDLIDLLQRLLKYDPVDRLTAQEAMKCFVKC